DESRQAKVGKMRFALLIQQNVSRLDVSMQNAVLMGVMHDARHLSYQFCRLPDRHRLAPDYFIELAAFDELHAEIARAIALADLVDWNDTGMLQPRCRFGFQAEPLQVRFGGPLAKTNDF